MIVALLALVGASYAQDQEGGVDARGQHLAASDGDVKDPLIGWRPEAQRPGAVAVGGMFEYAEKPLLRYYNNRGTIEREKLLDNLFGLNLSGAFGVHERVGITLSLPLWFTSVSLDGPQGVGLGDVRLAIPLGLVVPSETDGGFGLSVIPLVDLPTGSRRQFLGNGSVSGGAILAAGFGKKRWEIDANVGVRQTPGDDVENLTGGPQLLGSLAGALMFDDHHGLRAEGILRSALEQSPVPNSQSPSEALLSFRGRYDQGFSWTVGGAAGLNGGAGAAVFRVFAGAGYVFGKQPEVEVLPARLTVVVVDEKGRALPNAALVYDGRTVELDPEGAYAKKNLVTGTSVDLKATLKGYTPGSKIVELDEGANTVEIQLTALPGQIVVKVVNEADGSPLPARVSARTGSAKGEPTDTDDAGSASFVVPAGSYQLFAEAEGFGVGRADATVARGEMTEVIIKLKPAKVAVTTDKVVILEKVFFVFDQATLIEDSKPLLAEVADTLLAHPELLKIEIAGHTDSRGGDQYNLDLSQRRVETVRDYLIGRGVEPDRLVAKGYGESVLLDKADTEEAHQLNRRVEFTILERADEEKK
jgi:OOP family OmpA-OmpF porin